MILLDVNILVYAHREDSPKHLEYRRWVESLLESGQIFGLPDLVLSGFLRIVTHPKIFNPPTPVKDAWEFVEKIRQQPQCVSVSSGNRHWDIFKNLCQSVEAKGNIVPDAYLAALAIEMGAEWVTTDRDYSRFPGLKWKHPLEKKK
jgi:hypothetical protein